MKEQVKQFIIDHEDFSIDEIAQHLQLDRSFPVSHSAIFELRPKTR